MKIVYIDCFYGFDVSMLLGALIDAGASEERICALAREHMEDFSLNVSKALSCSMECTMARAGGSALSERALAAMGSASEEKLSATEGVLSALEEIGAECVICSPLRIPYGTDGELLSLLDKSSVDTQPGSGQYFSHEDVLLLTHIVSESGPLPHMDILSVGYGCSSNPDSLVTVYVGQYGTDVLNEELQYENSYS